ncbi:phosphate acyltransferase PlsX [bacterium]
MIRIAVDAMGGDEAPEPIVQGAIEAARVSKERFEVVLVGDEVEISKHIHHHHFVKGLPISVHHASQTIEMNESPGVALRKKPDSSIAVGAALHAKGKVDALVSAGNTGAVLGAALFTLKRIDGVIRPAIGSFMPTSTGVCFLIDVGTNVDCKPEQLYQFGLMGSIFMSHVLGVERPKVGLLNIGEEPGKGNELVQKTYPLFEKSDLNFIGNIEGRDVLTNTADVIVCDGFIGNVLLKFGESLTQMLPLSLKKKIGSNLVGNFGFFFMQHKFRHVVKLFDYQEYGGAPLLGIKGNCIVAHGRSTPRAIRTAIIEAYKMVKENVAGKIESSIKSA